jgi:FkbM family methyltransferase
MIEMSVASIASRFHAPVARVKGRAKDALRKVVPPHYRFVRSGEFFLQNGEREVHLLSTLVEPDTVALDVGAHIGEYSYAICKQLGKSGRVIAIEPIADLANFIERAARRLRLPITVVNCALSSRAGAADILIPVKTDTGQRKLGFATLENRNETGETFRIGLRRLDDICADVPERISFIKIDVEGHELEVLRGAVETLARHRPNLLIEIEQRHSTVPIDQTFSFITAQGYNGEFLDPAGQLVALSKFDPAVHQVPREDWIATPKYVSNFIFRPKPA